MGYLHISEKEHFRFIKSVLRRRGLKPVIEPDNIGETEWQIHGPHQDMDYQVYIGQVYEDEESYPFFVVIYPRGTYWIENPRWWWRVDPEDRIPTV